jgi:hypothetical protein
MDAESKTNILLVGSFIASIILISFIYVEVWGMPWFVVSVGATLFGLPAFVAGGLGFLIGVLTKNWYIVLAAIGFTSS